MVQIEAAVAVVAWFIQLILVAYSYGQLTQKVANVEQAIKEIKFILRARGSADDRNNS